MEAMMMVSAWRGVVGAVVCMGLAAGVSAAGVPVVAEGKAVAVIVISEEAGPVEQWAAEELRDHVKLMSGAELGISRIKGDAVAKFDQPTILLGEPAVKAGLVKTEALGDDGYVIKADGQCVAIAGGKRGTLYGVYTLLETLGVRWWTPTERFVPQMATVTIPAMELREVPKLEYRDMMYAEMVGEAGQLWTVRNKMNGFRWQEAPAKFGGRYRFVGNLVHSYGTLLKASGMPITEEMKALVNGKRSDGQPCLSNPDTFKAILKSVLAAFEKMPDAKFVVVGQDDNRNYCRCPECQKLIDAEGASGPVIDFANRIAEAVEKERPGSAICTAAYEWSRQTPETLKPRDNVYITLCSIECDFAHPIATSAGEVNAAFRRDMEAWGKIAKKIYIWDYTTNFRAFLAPFPNVDVLVPNVKFFADNAAAGVFEQGAHTGRGADFVELKMWLLARALWNPEVDGKAMVKEFCEGYYGPAGAGIQECLDAWHKPARTQDFVMRIYRLMDAPYHEAGVIAEAAAALKKADEAAKGNVDLERRVRHAWMSVRYMLAKRGPGSATWKAVESKIGPVDMSVVASEFARTVEEYGIDSVADHEVVKPFVEWMQDYAKLVKEKGGAVIPPELAGKDASTYRVIQGCQFDDRGRWYERVEGASDGWCIKQPTEAWTIRSVYAAGEHFTVGKKYKLCMRVKGTPESGVEASKAVWNWGVSSADGKYPIRGKVTAEQMKGGAWTVIESAEWTPANGDNFYFATDPKTIKAVYLDCMWLEEVK